jgi:glycosyltransferase involved in cell wall biosynthesis
MRVLHAHSGNLWGGIETMLMTLASSGRDVLQHVFALCFEGRLLATLRQAGADVHQLNPVRFGRPWTVLKARRQFAQLLRRAQPEVVICHSPWSLAVFGPAVRAAGVPLVAWLHAPPMGSHWLELLARRAPPDLAVCNSRFTQAAVLQLSRNLPREVVYPPVAHPAPRTGQAARGTLRAKLGTPLEATVIVQVSRMEAGKGQQVLIEALGQLRDVPGWRCWQIGGAQRSQERAYQRALERRASDLGVGDRVCLLGERPDVHDLLAASDVFCQPNTTPDSFGISFIEALYAGLPIVTSGIGGALEIVDETCGLLVPPGDVGALRSALAQLLLEPDLRMRLGSRGPARAAALCDPEQQIARLRAAVASVARRL